MRFSMTVILMTALLCGVALAEGGLTWRTHAEAMPEAAREGKPVIIHFTADWCSWCTKMKKETYTAPAVAKIMNEDFVVCMVNSDENPLLNMYYGVQSLPTIWILGSDGHGITRISGYRDAAAFEMYLTWVTSGAYHQQPFEAYAAANGS